MPIVQAIDGPVRATPKVSLPALMADWFCEDYIDNVNMQPKYLKKNNRKIEM